MLKKIFVTILCTTATLFGIGFWLKSLIPPAPDHQALARTQVTDIPYLHQASETESRGKILLVVTSVSRLGNTGKDTGYEFTELVRPYYVFKANGFSVDIASPQGGEPPAVMDKDDMGNFEYAFLNDTEAMETLRNSLPLTQVNAGDYRGIFFVGGKGAMFDFPRNPAIQDLIVALHNNGGVIGAVCHGPAALADITLESGEPFIQGHRISGFTNAEELFLIPDAEKIFPFLLEDRLRSNGAIFEEGPLYLNQVSVDNRIITGQNPWSSWEVTESMVKALGYESSPRQVTGTERTVEILLILEKEGHAEAKETLLQFIHASAKGKEVVDRRLLAMHGIVAVMRGELAKAVDIVRLLATAKSAMAGSQLAAEKVPFVIKSLA
ncbi:type 1 glutamine amidotransferase domain-containing protein [uncultured Microbulbifer sp.]|uniref:type 1 glutamine amidotransferase domain-containing protein n=1 Tax=uncultured Microbulbifer sp. TaxID=348147 RepID=UPI002611C892|nr:type 1 glutamine amidotransferase domain-containing protein [uncultured Microbulbifer sp.]